MTKKDDEIAQAEAYMRRYRRKLAASPIVDVLGVVSPSGVSAGRSGDEEVWTLQLTLTPWRFPGGELQPKVLGVHRPVTDKELRKFRSLLKPFSVVRVKAHIGVTWLGFPDALLEEVVGVDKSDAELNAKAKELRKPVTFADPKLGTFTMDRSVDWFTAKTEWMGQPVSLNLSATKPKDLQKALTAAHTLWRAQKGWSKRIGNYAVKELLPLKNDYWLGDDETKLNAKQFKARMTLRAITVTPRGSFEFWHDDGDLFWGHSIQVAGDIRKGLNDAGIHG